MLFEKKLITPYNTNMKKIIKLYFILIALSSVFYSCSVSSMSKRILVPADISIDKNIEYIGIINYVSPKNRLLDFVEGFLSHESIFADKIGADFCLKVLAEKLNNSPRFTPVIIYGERFYPDKYNRRLPAQIPWATVDRICRKYRLDGLIALEHFDSDIYLKKSLFYRKIKTKNKNTGIKIKKKVKRYRDKLFIKVSSAWRIYSAKARTVLDAEIYTDDRVWTTTGKTPGEALSKLPGKRNAINESGFNSGLRYGERISPTWTTITRFYYVKGCLEFEDAKRSLKTGDWDGAIHLWKRVLNSSDPELQGQAAYNLAFAAEMRSDFKSAYKWCKMAYTLYNNKRAYRYMNEIHRRILGHERLKEQLD
jgi:tetratricopeptide (TPR) repeat protein